MTELPKLALTYEERAAINTLRKSMRNKPYIITMLLDGQTEEIAWITLKKLKDEMNTLLTVNRAFTEAAKALIPKKPDANDPS